ncbi:MAG: peptide-methionine (S)-S-oxide reductase MsrA [Alphaproteobacteria bacterium]|nr:peptide-methionine (S)-S-oxide reductase MsrA [Alphaproteobacteria bacterium]
MSDYQTALLAGGCFWGMEDLFRKLPGVVDTEVGYAGGATANPTYDQVKTGKTGHAESIRILFDPSKTDYASILRFFFQIHDPTTRNRQGNDVGTQYRSAIFYLDDDQKRIAEETIAAANSSSKWPGEIVTELTKAGDFTRAEDFHQDYLVQYPAGYTCHFIRPDWRLA